MPLPPPPPTSAKAPSIALQFDAQDIKTANKNVLHLEVLLHDQMPVTAIEQSDYDLLSFGKTVDVASFNDVKHKIFGQKRRISTEMFRRGEALAKKVGEWRVKACEAHWALKTLLQDYSEVPEADFPATLKQVSTDAVAKIDAYVRERDMALVTFREMAAALERGKNTAVPEPANTDVGLAWFVALVDDYRRTKNIHPGEELSHKDLLNYAFGPTPYPCEQEYWAFRENFADSRANMLGFFKQNGAALRKNNIVGAT